MLTYLFLCLFITNVYAETVETPYLVADTSTDKTREIMKEEDLYYLRKEGETSNNYYSSKPDDYDTAMDRVLEVVEEMKPDVIVLGLPLLENGDVAERAQICLEFGKVLEVESGIPVKMQDERNTTQESESILLMADVSRKHRKKKIDQLAAVQILQRYLDSH